MDWDLNPEPLAYLASERWKDEAIIGSEKMDPPENLFLLTCLILGESKIKETEHSNRFVFLLSESNTTDLTVTIGIWRLELKGKMQKKLFLSSEPWRRHYLGEFLLSVVNFTVDPQQCLNFWSHMRKTPIIWISDQLITSRHIT